MSISPNPSQISCSKLFWFLFGGAIFLLPIDNFALGISLLREFGARTTNFFLLIAFLVIVLHPLLNLPITHIKLHPIVTMFSLGGLLSVLISVTSLYTADLFLKSFRNPYISFFFQLLMLFWGILSVYIWCFFLKHLQIFEKNQKKWRLLLIIAASINLLAFIDDWFWVLKYIFGIGYGRPLGEITEPLLTFLRGKFGYRAAGLASEPSLFGSWANVIWPLLMINQTSLTFSKRLFYISRILGTLVIASAFLSGSRTFMVLFIFQLGLFFILRKNVAVILGSITSLILFITFFVPAKLVNHFYNLLTLADLSSIARVGSFSVSWKMYFDYPFVGVGLGQFSSYYKNYVSDAMLSSREVQLFVAGDIQTRISAYNLFGRIAAESGSIALFCLLILLGTLLWKLLKCADAPQGQSIFLALIGGIGFWLTQDQFGYQPGLFSIAVGIVYIQFRSPRSENQAIKNY